MEFIMRPLTITSTVIGLSILILAGCSKTGESESNFKDTINKYFVDKSNNPTCDSIILGKNITSLSDNDVANYQVLQKAGYVTFSQQKVDNASMWGPQYHYSAALTDKGKSWVINIKQAQTGLGVAVPSLQEADYCLGMVKVMGIQDYTDLKRAEEYSGKKVVEVIFNYQIANIPDNLKDNLGKPFAGTMNGKATLVAMTKGWHVEDMRLNQNV